jgi:uncharacterized OB-fold protein
VADKFVPVPTPETAVFWDKARLGELWLPVCVQTGRMFLPPRPFSPFVPGGPVSWARASGRARLTSYVVVHRPDPGFEDEGPYIVAIAELEEGPRMVTNLERARPEPDALPLGAPLELTFERRGGMAIPQFRLAERQA